MEALSPGAEIGVPTAKKQLAARRLRTRIETIAPQGDGGVDVRYIYPTKAAFAALKTDGTVVAWGAGDPYEHPYDHGGDCSKVPQRLVDVQYIYASSHAFAAIKADGTIVTWGASSDQKAAHEKAAASKI